MSPSGCSSSPGPKRLIPDDGATGDQADSLGPTCEQWLHGIPSTRQRRRYPSRPFEQLHGATIRLGQMRKSVSHNDALMFVKGVGWRFGVRGFGVVGWCSDRVIAGLRTRQGWASVMARKLLLGHASGSEMRPGTAGESFEGQQVRGSRISGQAVPGDLGVSRRPGGGGGRPPGRRNASGSG